MLTNKTIFRLFIVLIVVLLMSSTASARPLDGPPLIGTGFTYQGSLTDGDLPANGSYDFEFKLFNALSGGDQVGETVSLGEEKVTNGLFTVQLDFGRVFDGTALYLEIGVRPGGSGDEYTLLEPRQPLTATPYALYTKQAGNAALLNDQQATYYQNASNINSGTLGANYFSAYPDLVAEGYLGNAASDLALNNGILQATLNSDLLDGYHAGNASGNIPINNGTLNTNLNSDLLDGQHGTYYQNASNINSGTLGTNYFSAYADLVAESKIGAGSGQVAAGDHNHWGQTWSGSGTGLWLSGGTTGLAGDGSAYGVYGSSSSTGVYGSGDNKGIWGYSSSGYGVYGISSSSTGVYGSGSTGVSGTSSSTSGTGVSGSGTGTSGIGVSGTGSTGVVGTSSIPSGYGVSGSGTGTGGTGVYGSGVSYGVSGTSSGTGVYGSGDNKGIWGYSSSGYGVYGISSNGIGVYGTSYSTFGYGVSGSGAYGVYGYANTSGGYAIYGLAYGGAYTDYAGYFQGNVYIAGDLIATGGKSAAVETQDYGTRALYAVESPENWFEDFGTGQLVNGTVVIPIESIFAQTVNLSEDYHVFLTPLGDCALFVDSKTPASFTVKAIGGGTCSIAFDYRIVAKRLGYENVRLAEVTDTQPVLEAPGQ